MLGLGLRNFLDGLTESVRLFCGTLINNVRLGLGLGIFLDVVSLKVSDFFEGNSTSKTLTKFDDQLITQTHPVWDLEIF